MSIIDEDEMFKYTLRFRDVLNGTAPSFSNLVGFFDSPVEIEDRCDVNETVEMILTEFADQLDGAILYSTATNFCDIKYYNEEEIKIVRKLESLNWLRYDLSEKEIYEGFSKVIIKKQDFDNLKVFFSFILNGLADGYVYVYCQKEKLVIYPHRQEGFGFQADKKTHGYKIAMRFLKKVESTKACNYVVGYEAWDAGALPVY